MKPSLLFNHPCSMLTAALAYAANGVPVFPLQPNSKLPAFRGSWKEHATTDENTIRRWFTDSDYNLAGALGERSNVMALDVDMKKGRNGWQSLLDIEPPDLTQPMQKTPTGGLHIFMQYVPGINNFARKGTHSGLDMRTEGGYVALAPSMVDGVRYEFIKSGDVKKPNGKLITFLRDATNHYEILNLDMPEPTPIEQLPPLNELTMSPHHIAFLIDGVVDDRYDSDRSAALFAATKALYARGLSDGDVLGYLENSFAMDLATERRPAHSQLEWLWKYNCLKAAAARPISVHEIFGDPIVPVDINEAFPQELFHQGQVPLLTPIIEEVPAEEVTESDEKKRKFDRLVDRASQLDIDDHEKALRIYMEADALGSVYASSIMHHLTLWSRKDLEKDAKGIREQESFSTKSIRWKYRNNDGTPKPVASNFKLLCKKYDINIRYNLMLNDIEITEKGIPIRDTNNPDNELSYLRDLCAVHNMANFRTDEHIRMVANKNIYHPVLEILNNTRWDGVSRLQLVFNTLQTPHPYERNFFLFKWCLGAIAMLHGFGQKDIAPKAAIVLVGSQHIGKTSWLRYLSIGEKTFGEGLFLDMHNKDTILAVLRFWIAELGEIDRTFTRSEAAALKSFIGNREDILRVPYGRKSSEIRRRTVLAGTVNPKEFLIDDTGNSRYLPIEVTSIDLNTMEDLRKSGGMVQFWKEMEHYYWQGYEWWFNREESDMLQAFSKQFEQISPIEQKLLDKFDWSNPKARFEWMSYTEVADYLHINTQGLSDWRKPMRIALRKLTGMDNAKLKKVDGQVKRAWPMPIKTFN